MFADEQTHTWPHDENLRLELAALQGADNLQNLETEMENVFLRVHDTYSALFPGEEDLSSPMGSLVFTGVEPEPMTLETLAAYGFKRGPQVWRQMADWLGGRIPATRTPRARELLTRLAPRIIEFCGSTNEPDVAFFTFSNFVGDLNAGVTLFSMFKNKPAALNALIEMLVLAPSLAKMLSDQPSLIDAMIEPNFLTQKGTPDRSDYLSLIDKDADFETALNIVRRAVHEDLFSLTAGLLTLQNLQGAGDRFTEIAGAAIDALIPCAVAETERLFGPIYGEFAILGFGKLGGREMSHGSDLDVVLVYETDRDGAESADKQTDKFNKLTRRIITALSINTEAGGLYEVDMALRPSGRSGPLAVSLRVFEKYYRDDAWTWEFMALSRARVISGSSSEFAIRVANTIERSLQSKDFGASLAPDVLEMHARLARDKPPKGFWDIKGKLGGLRDIEFIAQYLVLKNKLVLDDTSTISMLKTAQRMQVIGGDDAAKLINICAQYQVLLQLLKLAANGIYETDEFSHSFKLLLNDQSDCSSFEALEDTLNQAANTVISIFKEIITLDN
jgi:glutamate-ammonia-ligase adenylyltransferase